MAYSPMLGEYAKYKTFYQILFISYVRHENPIPP